MSFRYRSGSGGGRRWTSSGREEDRDRSRSPRRTGRLESRSRLADRQREHRSGPKIWSGKVKGRNSEQGSSRRIERSNRADSVLRHERINRDRVEGREPSTGKSSRRREDSGRKSRLSKSDFFDKSHTKNEFRKLSIVVNGKYKLDEEKSISESRRIYFRSDSDASSPTLTLHEKHEQPFPSNVRTSRKARPGGPVAPVPEISRGRDDHRALPHQPHRAVTELSTETPRPDGLASYQRNFNIEEWCNKVMKEGGRAWKKNHANKSHELTQTDTDSNCIVAGNELELNHCDEENLLKAQRESLRKKCLEELVDDKSLKNIKEENEFEKENILLSERKSLCDEIDDDFKRFKERLRDREADVMRRRNELKEEKQLVKQHLKRSKSTENSKKLIESRTFDENANYGDLMRQQETSKCDQIKALVKPDDTALESLVSNTDLRENRNLSPISMVMHNQILKQLQSPNKSNLLTRLEMDLTKHDLMSLVGNNWLNDSVVEMFFSLIADRSLKGSSRVRGWPTVFTMSTFFFPNLRARGYEAVRKWTKGVDIFSYEMIFFPINFRQHWSLAVADLRKKHLIYCDSMGFKKDVILAIILYYLKQECKERKNRPLDDWSFLEAAVPQQENGYDCGVFCIKIAEFFSRDAQPELSQQDMRYFRKLIMWELLRGKLVITEP